MNKLCTIAARTQTQEFVDFCVADAKGRAIGCCIRRYFKTYVHAPEGQTWGTEVEPGDYITVEVQKTLNGKLWGATQTGKLFRADQVAEAEAYAAKRVADSQKKAAR